MENNTGLDIKASLTNEEKLHVQIMSDVACSFSNTPLVLKGGTALLLAYGLDRFSEDLDFDSDKHMNLESKIKKSVSKYAKVEAIDVKKQTSTAMRYRATYSAFDKQNILKIEISFRNLPKPDDINIIGGIKIYKLPALINQKLNTLEERTKARDLYDVAFLASKYLDQFGSVQLKKLQNITQNLDVLEKRFTPAFQRDLVLANVDVQGLVLSLCEAGNSIATKL